MSDVIVDTCIPDKSVELAPCKLDITSINGGKRFFHRLCIEDGLLEWVFAKGFDKPTPFFCVCNTHSTHLVQFENLVVPKVQEVLRFLVPSVW